MKSRGVITFAIGKPRHIQRAKALARSLMLHDPTVMRAIITDSTDRELGDLFTYQVQYRSGYGPLARQKLFLDRYTPFQETLFIDSASLAVHNLDAFWTAFQDLPFGVCGTRVLRRGEKHPDFDVPALLDRFHLASIPAFSGAAYYFKRCPESKAVFDTARDLSQNAVEFGFNTRPDAAPARIPSDEAIFSVAMALHGLSGTDMGTRGMYTAIDSMTRLDLDVRKGVCSLVKRGLTLEPDILHAAKFVDSLLYLRECSRLERQAHGGPELSRGDLMQLRSTAAVLWARRKVERLFNRFPNPIPQAPRLTSQH
jgi:hypothetical protein